MQEIDNKAIYEEYVMRKYLYEKQQDTKFYTHSDQNCSIKTKKHRNILTEIFSEW